MPAGQELTQPMFIQSTSQTADGQVSTQVSADWCASPPPWCPGTKCTVTTPLQTSLTRGIPYHTHHQFPQFCLSHRATWLTALTALSFTASVQRLLFFLTAAIQMMKLWQRDVLFVPQPGPSWAIVSVLPPQCLAAQVFILSCRWPTFSFFGQTPHHSKCIFLVYGAAKAVMFLQTCRWEHCVQSPADAVIRPCSHYLIQTLYSSFDPEWSLLIWSQYKDSTRSSLPCSVCT